jgi:hypothetical protein
MRYFSLTKIRKYVPVQVRVILLYKLTLTAAGPLFFHEPFLVNTAWNKSNTYLKWVPVPVHTNQGMCIPIDVDQRTQYAVPLYSWCNAYYIPVPVPNK